MATVKARTIQSGTPQMKGLDGLKLDENNVVVEEWDSNLPRPPSQKNLNDDDVNDDDVNENDVNEDDWSSAEQVAVFGANTQEGFTLVRMLSEKGLRVVAAVRVFASKKTKLLIGMNGVTVKQADTNDRTSVLAVLENCSRAFAVVRYWEKFESIIEETMATSIIEACASVTPPVKNMVLATFEDLSALKLKGRRSQIVPTQDGRIYPSFEGKRKINSLGKSKGVAVTHMMTSFSNDKDCKKSLILLRGTNKRIVAKSHIEDRK